MRRMRTRALVGALILTGALAAAAVPTPAPQRSDANARAGTPPAVAPSTEAPARGRTDSRLRSAFSVLRRPRSSGDTLDGRTEGMPTRDYFRALVKRLPSAPPKGDALPRASEGFVAPGPRGTLCLLVIPPGFDGPGGVCVEPAQALAGELTYAVGAGGDMVEVSGVVPDGVEHVDVRTDLGRVARLPVLANAYGALVRGRPLELRLHGRDGRVRRLPF